MKTKPKLYGIATVLILSVLVFLGITWWVNGRDETWLYAICAVIAITSFIPIFSNKNKDKLK